MGGRDDISGDGIKKPGNGGAAGSNSFNHHEAGVNLCEQVLKCTTRESVKGSRGKKLLNVQQGYSW